MSAEQRLQAASSLFDTARAIVAASLPPDLRPATRRLAQARRMYGNELPPAALHAHAHWLSIPRQGD
jgi:hypothetical protein